MSSKRPESLDFDKDLPTTPDDVAALRRIRESRRMSFVDALHWLSRNQMPSGSERHRKTHKGHEPFEL